MLQSGNLGFNKTVTIYAIDGTVIRRLALGHQPIRNYQSKPVLRSVYILLVVISIAAK